MSRNAEEKPLTPDQVECGCNDYAATMAALKSQGRRASIVWVRQRGRYLIAAFPVAPAQPELVPIK